MKSTAAALLAAAALLGSAAAHADDEVFNNSLRAGFESVFYHTKADDLQGAFVPAGVNFKAENLETLYVGFVRRIYSRFDLELALGYPPLSKVEGKGPATLGSVPYNGEVVSSARWLSPTVLFEFRLLDENSKWQPYVGAGVNYTAFYSRDSTAQGNAASGGPTRLSLTSSVGPAGTVGLLYRISSHWQANASYTIARVNTRIDAETAGFSRSTRIDFGPQVLVISGGYAF